MTSPLNKLWFVKVCAICLAWNAAFYCAGAELTQIISAWKAREVSAATLDVSWKGERLDAISPRIAQHFAKTAATEVPPERITYEIVRRFVSDGRGRVRLEDKWAEWDSETRGVSSRESVQVWDGGLSTTLLATNNKGFPYLAVDEARKRERMVRSDVRTLPLRVLYRPLSGNMAAFDEAQLRIVDEHAGDSDSTLVVLRHGEATITSDSRKQFVPVRYSAEMHGSPECVVDIEYVEDRLHGWLPSKWKLTLFSPKKQAMLFSESCEVTRCQVGIALSDSAFDIEPPPNTWVRNGVSGDHSILRPDGSERKVLPGEYQGTNYDEIVASESGDLLPARAETRSRVLWIALNLAVIVAIVCIFALRSYRRRGRLAL